MLIVQDVHVVIGREEIPFDDGYRDQLAPRIAEDPGTRLAAFFWAPHGGGAGYEAVTLTAVADTAALDRLQNRLTTGDLAGLWDSLEAKQRSMQSSLNIVASWSSLAEGGVEQFVIEERPTAMFRLDSFTVPGSAAAAMATLQPTSDARSSDDAVAMVGCWSPFLGELDEPTVTVLSRVKSDDALRSSFAAPANPWTGVPSLAGAHRMTRLLRSSPWSPIH